uniref:Uncharacterized protein n=1 Tax=Eutreptiella gymnastica TaxID=73025 RepID=A0A7S4CWF3_9EUGL|mmetsp:Transcript_5759/g.10576  ORF Transcript_5759/g.10576 Transcript_5759/m.10576 type:complete len:116 (+) Transcript_5759:274-621(+)
MHRIESGPGCILDRGGWGALQSPKQFFLWRFWCEDGVGLSAVLGVLALLCNKGGGGQQGATGVHGIGVRVHWLCTCMRTLLGTGWLLFGNNHNSTQQHCGSCTVGNLRAWQSPTA